jgi:Aspartyl protease
MTPPLCFPYMGDGPAAMPVIPLTLRANGRTLEIEALLDTGASVNVLPYDVGLALGLNWEQETVAVELAGNLATAPARAVVAMAQLEDFTPKRLVFAWSQNSGFRTILGQMNFFMEFNVCFFRGNGVFELLPHEVDGHA